MPPFFLTTGQYLQAFFIHPVNKIQQLNTLFLQHTNSLKTHQHRSTPVQLERGMEIKNTCNKVFSEKVKKGCPRYLTHFCNRFNSGNIRN